VKHARQGTSAGQTGHKKGEHHYLEPHDDLNTSHSALLLVTVVGSFDES
jgi:hypothetical protein